MISHLILLSEYCSIFYEKYIRFCIKKFYLITGIYTRTMQQKP